MKPFFAREFRKTGFELLAWAEVGNVHLFSRKPIRKVEDLRGLKVWTWSGDPIAKETFTAMGVNPIPLAITDVTTAINTGMIDTVYATPLGALALQWHRAMKYMMALPLVHSTGAILLSKRYFDRMPAELAQLLVAETDAAMKGLTGKLRKQSLEAMKSIAEAQLTILSPPTGKALEDFYEIHEEVARNLTGVIYPEEVLERLYRILQRSAKSP
jgi:TRAP-type C4-dicarboxylate transport system substrate-binding protein